MFDSFPTPASWSSIKYGLTFKKLHLFELFNHLTNLEEFNSELLESMNMFRKIEDILTNIPSLNGKKLKINLCM